MLDKSFQEITSNIKNAITRTQLEIMTDANKKLVNLYYNIGKMLEENSSWGNKFIDNVAMNLKMSFPNLKGFSVRNLKYMKIFYNEYKNDEEFVQLVAQLPWKHNITLMQKVKDKEIRKWYMNKCLEDGWSDSVLVYQIDTNLYDRQEKAIKHNNFELTLKQNSELANNMMKEPYVFDLIELTEEEYEELDRLATLMLDPDKNFDELLQIWNSESKYRIMSGALNG